MGAEEGSEGSQSITSVANRRLRVLTTVSVVAMGQQYSAPPHFAASKRLA